MNCPKCQHENSSSANFCSNCGTKLQKQCSECGAEVGSTDRFCSECGTALTTTTKAEATKPTTTPQPLSYTPPHLAERILSNRKTIEGERRTVTVLYADAKGFTPISEHFDNEVVYNLVKDFVELMMESAHRYEGTITQFRGDGVLALFGAPLAHEDSARRAVAAALDMQKALGEYADKVSQQHGIELHFRIGLNTGFVVVGKVHDDLTMDYTAHGDTANLGARIEAMAEPGTVYLSEHTYRAVADYFECESLGAFEVRGIAKPVGVYKVVREKPVRTRFEAAVEHGLTPFVGRHQELTVLLGYLQQAKRGTGQVVFVSGEAGIGKSRLLLEFRRSNQNEDVTWLTGQCISFGQSISYLPFIDILKRAFGIEERDKDTRIIERIDAHITRWDEASRESIPFLKYLLSANPGHPTFDTMDSQARRAGIFDALRALFIEESRKSILVVVVEDLHWTDEQSEAALAALVDVVASVPVLLILSYRPGYTHSLGERTYYSRLSLSHLLPDEGAEIASSVLGVADLPDELQQLITSKAEGNPFYIEEVTKSLIESGVLRQTDGNYTLLRPIEQIHVPNTIGEVILSRIDRLQRHAKEAIQLASVIGREFTVRLLDRVSDIEAKLEDLLGELKALELIYQKQYFSELSYLFKHALTQDVAYSTLLIQRRKALHCLIGMAIEELYADRLPEQYEVLAHHYSEGEDWAKALDYLVKSGKKAAAAYANRDALAYFDRAEAVSDRLGDVSAETLMDIYAGKAEVRNTMNALAEALANYNRLRKIARTVGNRTVEGLALCSVAQCQTSSHRFDQAMVTAQEALTIALEDQNNVVKIRALGWLLYLDVLRGHLHGAEERAEEVVLLSERVGYEIPRDTLAFVYCVRGRFEQARRVAEKNVDITDRHTRYLGRPQRTSRLFRLFALAGYGAYSDAIVAAWDYITLSERMDGVESEGKGWNTLGWIYSELHDWEQAMVYNQKALELGKTLGDDEILMNTQINLADCAFGVGDREKARQELEALYDSLDERHEWMK